MAAFGRCFRRDNFVVTRRATRRRLRDRREGRARIVLNVNPQIGLSRLRRNGLGGTQTRRVTWGPAGKSSILRFARIDCAERRLNEQRDSVLCSLNMLRRIENWTRDRASARLESAAAWAMVSSLFRVRPAMLQHFSGLLQITNILKSCASQLGIFQKNADAGDRQQVDESRACSSRLMLNNFAKSMNGLPNRLIRHLSDLRLSAA
jgi:hypothetical protein